MQQLTTGQYFGKTNKLIQIDGITFTDTVYIHEKVDWHYHQNPYFTFLLQGGMTEGNKKESYTCSAGSLLFHNWQEAHHNTKSNQFTRGFHVEIDKHWFKQWQVNTNQWQGSFQIKDPGIRLLMYSLYAETQNHHELSCSANELLLHIFSGISDQQQLNSIPAWANTIKEYLHDCYSEQPDLKKLAVIANVHPVHLSRDFSKYFHCTITAYLRKIRIAKSLILLAKEEHTLSSIAFMCGFADQSHFIRSFRQLMKIKPSAYRKLLYRSLPC